MDTKAISLQLDELVTHYLNSLEHSQYDDASDILSEVEVMNIKTRAVAAIARVSGTDSIYSKQANDILNKKINHYSQLRAIIGILDALKNDLEAGFLVSFEELIHAELFSDFLDMAGYLLSSGFKDAAAVIAGSTLEAHIRQLCNKFKVASINESGKNKKADLLNSELAKVAAYSKIDQKNITAWLGLRNNAAHGNYNEYSKEQVILLISSIQDFITRNPA